MAGLLLSGPAGAGKSATARQELETSNLSAAVIDFQSIYASLLALERGANGRYPEREGRHAYLLSLAEYVRRSAISGAVQRELYPIVTNSDGDPERRQALLGLMGAGAQERIVDPGQAVVETRLTVNGQLSVQCQQAIDRWYGRL